MTEQNRSDALSDALWRAFCGDGYISPLSTAPNDVRRREEALRIARAEVAPLIEVARRSERGTVDDLIPIGPHCTFGIGARHR